jgi:plasmid stability protein
VLALNHRNGRFMATLTLKNLDEDVRQKLLVMAHTHGRTVEQEAQEILRAAVTEPEANAVDELGTRIASRFEGIGLEAEIRELRGQTITPPTFDP